MKNEYFDVVDSNDRPTGKLTTKEEAHNKFIKHRVVVVLVFKEDKLLVQVHKSYGRLLDHSVGGHVRTGESYKQAAERELREELGFNAKLDKVRLGVHGLLAGRDEFKNINHVYGIFRCAAPNNWDFKPNDEVDQMIKMNISDLVSDMNSNPEKYLSGFFVSLGAYLNHINSNLKVSAYGNNWGEL